MGEHENYQVPSGQCVVCEDKISHFCLETFERLPNDNEREKYKKEWKQAIMDKGKYDGKFDKTKTWPLTMRREINSIGDLIDYLKQFFWLINSPVYTRFYKKVNGTYTDEQLRLQDFNTETKRTILNNIIKEKKIVISRVLETNVKSAFDQIASQLYHEAIKNQGKPLIEFQLVPIDSLKEIAENESKKIDYLLKNGVPKEQILIKDSGISNIDYVTHLRHLWLYLGTITFCYALTVALPCNFKFYHGSSIPSARGTIVLDEPHSSDSEKNGNPLETLFVRINENDIGLNGNFYRFRRFGISDFDEKLYEEIKNRQSSNDFEKIIEKGLEIEEELLDNNRGLVDGLQMLKQSKVDCPLNKDFKVISFAEKWKNTLNEIKSQKLDRNFKQEDLEKITNDVGFIQKEIENILVNNVRRLLERPP